MPSIQPESPDQPEVHRLLQAADARAAGLYPGESRHGAMVQTLLDQKVRLFVVRQAGQAVGCGGYVADGQGSAELKRIFVEPAARGAGLGRLILTALEQAAAAEGIAIMLLETGVKSNEAICLYRRFGYTECGPFGSYGPDPLSVFMEKTLQPRLAGTAR